MKNFLAAIAVALFSFTAATAQTNLGPVNSPYINSTLYVGSTPGWFANIQLAVTYGCGVGQHRVVNIPAGYTGSDSITAVTGGCSAVYIKDERAIPNACYTLVSGSYAATSCSGGTGTGCTGPSGNYNLTGQITTITSGCITAVGAPYSMSLSCSAAGNFELGFVSTNPNACTLIYSNGSPASASLGDGTNTTTLTTPFTSGSLAFAYSTNKTFTANSTSTTAQTASATNSFTVNDCTFGGVGAGGGTGATASGSGACTAGETASITGTASSIPAFKLGNTSVGDTFTLSPSGQYIILLLTGGCSHTISVNSFTTSFSTTALTYTNHLGGAQTGMCLYYSPTSYTGPYTVVVTAL